MKVIDFLVEKARYDDYTTELDEQLVGRLFAGFPVLVIAEKQGEPKIKINVIIRLRG